MLRYRWTGEAFCFKLLTLPKLRKLIFSLSHSSFLQFQLPFKLLAALHSRSCYCSTPSDLLTSGPITTSDAVSMWPFSSYFCRFRQKFVTFIVFARQGHWSSKLRRYVSVVTRLRVCLFCTWQHWISIGSLSTLCRLTVHLVSTHGRGIYLVTEPHSSLLYLPKRGSLDWSLPFKTEAYFLDWHITLFLG